MKKSMPGRLKNIFLWAAFIGFGANVMAQNPEYYNDFAGNSNNSFPLNTTSSNKVQWIYAPTVFNSNGSTGDPAPSGYISHVYFKIGSANTSASYTNFTISLGQNQGTNSTWSSGTFVTGLTECFNQSGYSLTGATSGNWYGVELTTPFQYNPALALVFEMKVSGGTGNTVAQVNNSGQNQRIWGGYASSTGSTGTGLVSFGIDVSYAAVPNNAGITGIPSLEDGFCADTIPVDVEITNFGNNVLDSVYVDWTVNSTAQAGQWIVLGLDTAGSSNNDTVVNIGSYVFANGPIYDVRVWTTMPNNENDTVNENDTTAISVGAALVGTYVIGTGSGADYVSFTEAADDLNTRGVCGDVVFNVQSGTYNEQIAINEFPGSSEDATVTFQSLANNTSAVTLQYSGSTSAANNWVVKLNGADYVTFRKMKISSAGNSGAYANVFNMEGGSNNNNVLDCWLKGNSYSSTSTGNFRSVVYINGLNNDNTISNNRIEGGNPSIYAYGSGTTSRLTNLTIEHNELLDHHYYGAYLYYIDGLEFNHNVITNDSAANSTYMWSALYMAYDDNFNIIGNRMGSNISNGYYYTWYMSQCVGRSNPRSLVANNCVFSGAEGSSTYGYYGMYCTGSGQFDFYHNSLTRQGGTNGTYYPGYWTGGGLINAKNNSFVNLVSGYALYVSGGFTVTESDNNNFLNQSGAPIYYGTTAYGSLEQYQQATGNDLHSVSTDPEWETSLNCITCNDTLNGAGVPLAAVADDIDGSLRSLSTPDIGAMEYVTPGSFTLGGDDTLCGNSVMIESGPAQSVAWGISVNNGATQSYNTASVTLNAVGNNPTTFDVSVIINTLYCGTGSDQANILLVPNASLDSSLHICADEIGTLAPGGGSSASYIWSTGESSSSIPVTEDGTYSVVKTEFGCESQATTVVTKSTAVNLDDVEGCVADGAISMDATIPDGTSYAWNGGSSLITAVNTFNQMGTYNVTATDAFGCVSSDQFNVSFIDVPVANISETHLGGVFFFSSATSQYAGANATYFWDFGDGNTSTEANPIHAYIWSGVTETYNVSLSITNSCGEDPTSTTISYNVLSAENASKGELKVYPIPAQNLVTIEFGEVVAAAEWQILDLAGRSVLNGAITSVDRTLLDVSSLSAGSYILKVNGEGVINVASLIIE